MERRRLLATLAGALAPAAGCLATPGAGPPRGSSRGASTPVRVGDVDLPVSRDELLPAVNAVIPAIVEPAFADDWSGVEIASGSTTYRPRLRPGDPVVGVERAGQARAYPLSVLRRHEIVNDALGGPFLVTYCPQCGSAMTAIRRVRGREAVFTVSHLLWRANLLMRDGATGSLWSQILATAIRGPATGETLALVPSSLTTWGAWRADHPGTEVLLPPPRSETVYAGSTGKYGEDGYRTSSPVIGRGGSGGEGIADETLVVGVRAGGEAKAYPFGAVRERGVVNDVVGGVPVVVAAAPGRTLVAYERAVNGTTLRFRPASRAYMRAGGSRWLISRGVAVDGPHEGVHLRRANDLPPMFWFAWRDFHPDTAMYGKGW